MENKIGKFRETIKNSIIDGIGDKAWEKLQNETQVDVITSEMCYQSFADIDAEFDFSSAISPIMKGLENELKKYFYDGYVNFLNSHYNPNEYGQAIRNKSRSNDEDVAKLRRKIVYLKEGVLEYQLYQNDFTLGDFRYTVGVDNLYCPAVDKPFLDYCELDLFKSKNIPSDEIEKWTFQLVKNIESLRKLRNESSHAGRTQNKGDAEKAINDLIKIKKLLALIVLPPFIE